MVVFTFFTGQAEFVALYVCVCGVGGLFIALLPAINKPRSGRAECAGMGSRRKQKRTPVKVHFRSIRSIGMENSGAFCLFLLMSEVVKKKKKKKSLQTRTEDRLCAASAPSLPRLSRDLNSSVCVNEQSPPILLCDDEHGGILK